MDDKLKELKRYIKEEIKSCKFCIKVGIANAKEDFKDKCYFNLAYEARHLCERQAELNILEDILDKIEASK